MKKGLLLSVIVFFWLFFIPQLVFATSWAFPFVVWNDSIYVITDEVVPLVEQKIGKVTRYSDMEQFGGNFSNYYPKGTTYYAIEGIATTEAIAVEHEKGKYIKAVYESPYEFQGSVMNKAKMAFIAIVIAIMSFIIYYILPKFRNS
ncbi:hypothetical protein LZ480_19025 [Solibacillus sp. MA9]|uniref:DUF3592 domain-containing protein n=1 Tax=Solibacillus palustris TaxID=2908203 RepID=A0ABS9UHX8_9BACL|nr:hypothetical protein [Solibacillus sp. MA9]MCH7323959.1 hypothetical protein [Solibacillus sp. MA9]